MPKTRGPCRHQEYWPDDPSCVLKEVTRGLCRGHYEKARRLGLLEMKGTGPKGGRPTGPKLATALNESWLEGEEPSVAELRAIAKKLMKAILTDPGAAQQERNLAMKLAVTIEDKEGDEESKKRFQDFLNQARGLKAVE